MAEQLLHDLHDQVDAEVQRATAQRILEAEEQGNLCGLEAPVYRCHTFMPTAAGAAHARALTNQLNHIAQQLGVLGFQVTYKEDTLGGGDESGFFQIRVFAPYDNVKDASAE